MNSGSHALEDASTKVIKHASTLFMWVRIIAQNPSPIYGVIVSPKCEAFNG